jgi:hypothetical protein
MARRLSEYEIVYLFVDGIAERLRPRGKREPGALQSRAAASFCI